MKTAVLVLAAGRGERLGAAEPKGVVALLGRTLLARSVDAMLAVTAVDRVQPVVPAAYVEAADALDLPADPRVGRPVPGGVERQDSVAAGLEALPEEVEYVAVHDAARCLVDPADVAAVLEVAQQHGAAILAVPAKDTIKRAEGATIVETPTRASLWVAQTPQVFRVDWLREGLARARADGFQATDDAQLVERLGVGVRLVEGSPRNLKITVPEDLVLAEQLLEESAR